jgi:hypothetical protein
MDWLEALLVAALPYAAASSRLPALPWLSQLAWLAKGEPCREGRPCGRRLAPRDSGRLHRLQSERPCASSAAPVRIPLAASPRGEGVEASAQPNSGLACLHHAHTCLCVCVSVCLCVCV